MHKIYMPTFGTRGYTCFQAKDLQSALSNQRQVPFVLTIIGPD